MTLCNEVIPFSISPYKGNNINDKKTRHDKSIKSGELNYPWPL